jgi:hypothetical protein
VDPSVFHLIGLPGTGKYTVARAMERLATREGQRLVVVDNHHINNPILSLVDADGKNASPTCRLGSGRRGRRGSRSHHRDAVPAIVVFRLHQLLAR